MATQIGGGGYVRRTDLEAPVMASLTDTDIVKAQGIIGLQMCPWRGVDSDVGKIRQVDWDTLNEKEVDFFRADGGKASEIKWNEDDTDFVLQRPSVETWIEETRLERSPNPDKLEQKTMNRLRRDWYLLMEDAILTLLNANITNATTPAVKWDAGSGTTILEDIVNSRRPAENATQGLLWPNVFATSNLVWDTLITAAELLGYIGGSLDLSTMSAGQLEGWLKSIGFDFVYRGRGPNWSAVEAVYLMHADPNAALDAEDAMDSASLLYNDETGDGPELEVREYFENGSKHYYRLEVHALPKILYGDSARIIPNCLT